MTNPPPGTIEGHGPSVAPRRRDSRGEPLRLLHVHAHPDDESSKGAASTAKYVAEGVEVMVATCTGGERGDVLNPAMDRPEVWADIAAIRRAEMAAARDILGIEQTWLGFVDSGLPDDWTPETLPPECFYRVDLEVATEALVRVIRSFRPQVMTTYDEFGGYPHPDHIRCHEISVAAFEAAADPGRFPAAGEPWAVSKLYYHMTFTRDRITSLDRACHDAGVESPYADWIANFDDGRPDLGARVTTKVQCADFFEVRDAALLAHATQIDPDGRWFAIPMDIQKQAWPSEDFELARTRIDVETPEDDLFAGIAVAAGE